MKSILLFLSIIVVLLHAKISFPRIYEDDLKHSVELKEFHHTWNVDKEVTLNHNLLKAKEYSHYDSISIPQQYFTTGCNVPGYTGIINIHISFYKFSNLLLLKVLIVNFQFVICQVGLISVLMLKMS